MRLPFINHEIILSEDVPPGRLRTALDYWQGNRGSKPRPCWSDFELMDIYDVMPYATVKDVLDGGNEFRNRYFGSQLAHILGYDGTGKTMSEIFKKPEIDIVMEACQTTFRELCAVQSKGRAVWAENREFLNYTTLYLPIDDDTDTPAYLISVFEFTFENGSL